MRLPYSSKWGQEQDRVLDELAEALEYIAGYTKPGPTRNEYDSVIHATARAALAAAARVRVTGNAHAGTPTPVDSGSLPKYLGGRHRKKGL